MMASVRSSNTRSTERRLRSLLVREGVKGWHVQATDVIGKPDFVFPKARIAVFVDGCFWHGCPVCGRLPKSKSEYWIPKIEGNRARDRRVNRQLRREGWRVLRFWEHELDKARHKVVTRLRNVLINGLGNSEERMNRYDLKFGPASSTNLTKRRLAYITRRSLCDQGITPEQINQHIPGTWLWLSVEGKVDKERFLQLAQANRRQEGKTLDATRYFCDEDELIHSKGGTYALSNQWRRDTPDQMQRLLSAFKVGRAKIEAHRG